MIGRNEAVEILHGELYPWYERSPLIDRQVFVSGEKHVVSRRRKGEGRVWAEVPETSIEDVMVAREFAEVSQS